MYDRITLWVDAYRVEDKIPHLVDLLENGKMQTGIKDHRKTIYGSIQGADISIYESGSIRIGLSLPKFLYGDNITPLTRYTTEEAIGKLSDTLGIDVADARVSSLEYGYSFLMQHKATAYIERMGEMPRRLRYLFCSGGLYYRHRTKGNKQPDEFVFYDKATEAKIKKMPIPQGFEDANFLRIELKLNGSIAKQMGMAEVQASTLYNRVFYNKLRKRYIDTYFSITKLPKLNANFMDAIRSPKDAVGAFIGLMLAKAGQGQQEIDAYINELKANGIFKDRVNYKRVKDALYKAASKAKLSQKDELVAELDDAFINLKANGC